jgi:group I intron endonuclease
MDSIYKATNTITGKSYVGYSSNFHRRKIAHKTKSKNGSKYHFHNSIRKYGFDSIDWEILYEGNDALTQETRFIKEHDTFHNGYNLTEGGEGASGWKHTKEAKEKIAEASKGNTNTRGKTWKKTAESTRKSQVAQQKKYEITTPTGEVLIVKGLNEFCKKNNLIAQNMSKVSKGLRSHTGGYKCRGLE